MASDAHALAYDVAVADAWSHIGGVVLRAESHITVHTWPENGFIAIDIFMCGSCDPDLAADYIVNALQPARHHRTQIARGKGAT